MVVEVLGYAIRRGLVLRREVAMSQRASSERRAIQESAQTEDDTKKQKPRRRRSSAGLYTSWGGDDCLFFFRWAAADMGFSGQSIEPQAETRREGRRPVPFWDHDAARVQRDDARLQRAARDMADPGLSARKRRRALEDVEQLLAEDARRTERRRGGEARPGKIGGTRVRTNPERITMDNLAAAKRYGRVSAGMARLKADRPDQYRVLHLAFLPRRYEHKLERELRQFVGVALTGGPLVDAHAAAMRNEREPVTLEAWLLRRIERNDQRLGAGQDPLIERAYQHAEARAVEAVKAYEAVTAAPPEVERAQRERAQEAERAAKAPRAPRASVVGDFDPPGWRS